MLRNDELASLRKNLTGSPVAYTDSGIRTERISVNLGASTKREAVAIEEALSISFFPPEAVFGRPFDERCLAGVCVPTTIAMPEKSIRRIDNGRIIGYRSVLNSNGQLNTPELIESLDDFEIFIKTFRSEYDGYHIERSDNSVFVYFASRENPSIFRGRSLFVPFVETGNYGSFLIRGLPALLYAREQGLNFDRIVVPERTPWLMETLHQIGFRDIAVFSVREICGEIFEELYLISVADREGAFDEQTSKRLSRFAETIGVPSQPEQRIYISRRLSNLGRPRYRVLDNEAAVEQRVAQAGYTIVFPETLTLSAQIATFACATSIIGPSGSGMLNSIFAQPGTKVVDMESFHSTVRQHARLYSSSLKRYAFLFGELMPEDRPPAFRRWRVQEQLVDLAIDFLAS